MVGVSNSRCVGGTADARKDRGAVARASCLSVDQRLREVSDDVDESNCRECLGGESDELEVGALVAFDVFEESDKEIVCGCEIGIDRGVRRHERPSLSCTVR